MEVIVVGDHKHLRTSIAEIGQALEPVPTPAGVAGLADDPKGAELLRGEWGGKLDKSLLIRTARDIADRLVGRLPAIPAAGLRDGPDGGLNRGPARGPDGGPATAAAGGPLVSGQPGRR